MKYYIVHTQKTKTGETYEKWVPSANYELSAELLLKRLEDESDESDFLIVPFILTLCASLEANLNDWLIIDTFSKHGAENYRVLVEGYTGVSFAKKLRLVVPVLTDNTFQLREDSATVQLLINLISARNKITHPLMHYQIEQQANPANRERRDKLTSHPLFTLSAEECRKYYEAVLEFERKFFAQYEKGYIVENDLIREIVGIGQRVSDDTPKQGQQSISSSQGG